jgi:hypothetical protein
LKYFIAVAIFLLIIISWGMMKIELTGSDGIISNVLSGTDYYIYEIQDVNNLNEIKDFEYLLKTGIMNMFKFLGVSTLPLLTFLIPLGIYTMISKKELSNFLILFSIVIVLLIPAFYAYSRNFQEVRYLLVIFPILCIFSSFFIKNISKKVKYKKLFLIVFISIIIASTIGFIEYKNVNKSNQVEIYEFSKVVYSTVSITNYFSHTEYLDSMRMEYLQEFPILREDLPKGVPILYTDHSIKYENIEEFIEKNRINGLTHIIVDKGDSRTDIFNDIFLNEEKYTYLIKIFDTFDNGYKDYHGKIFEINYNEFYKLKEIMGS